VRLAISLVIAASTALHPSPGGAASSVSAGLDTSLVAATAWPTIVVHPDPSAKREPPLSTAQSAAQALSDTRLSATDSAARGYLEARGHYYFLATLYELLLLWLVLTVRLGRRYRDRLARVFGRRWVRAAIYVPAMLCTIGILSLPIDAQTHALALDFGHSRTNWLVWMSRWARTRAVDLAVASILVLLLYAIMRRSSRWWWLAVWIGFLANTTLAGYLRVRTFEITANSLEPVGWRYPEVVADMESVARNAGAIIPPERLVELTIPSGLGRPGYQPEFAAATPIGTLQRVIFAEQLIDDTSRPQLLFVFGHEMGHLVLHHDLKNRLIDAIILLALVYLAFRACGWMLLRWGPGWGITAMSDLASLPLVLFMLLALNFAKLPAFNATSRYFEHEADRYALEAIHGIVPNPGAAAAGVFDLCARKCGPDANLDGLMGFWFREHPTEVERTQFATTYDPWSHGRQPRYVRPALGNGAGIGACPQGATCVVHER
jgi:STE24 endopeptidase